MTPARVRELLDAAVALRRQINAALENDAEVDQWFAMHGARNGLNSTIAALTDILPGVDRGDRGQEDNRHGQRR